MKYLVILLILIGFAGIAYAESPPVIITQVELWGPESFHVDNVNACIFGTTSLGPWAVGWIELYNTQNKTITIYDVVLKSSSWEEGFQPITLEPNQYCYLLTQDKISTRVGPGGSLGNEPPPHNDEIAVLKYSEQTTQHAFSTTSLTDDYADTRTWQLVDGKWIFNEANIKLVPTKIRLDSPLKQFKSGISADQIQCNVGLVLTQKIDYSTACVKSESLEKLRERGWAKILFEIQIQPDQTKPTSEINVMCMTLEKSKDTATFFKVPSYLPDGYSFKCSFSGTPYESYMIFYNKKVPDEWVSHYPQLISEGAIFIHQTDEKRSVGEKEFATYGSASQRIQDTYDEVMVENPSLHPQLIKINGMLAYAVDSCSNCGKQTANFTDGTIIQKSTFTETKIKFIDENGITYFLEGGIPLNELVKVAESLQ